MLYPTSILVNTLLPMAQPMNQFLPGKVRQKGGVSSPSATIKSALHLGTKFYSIPGATQRKTLCFYLHTPPIISQAKFAPPICLQKTTHFMFTQHDSENRCSQVVCQIKKVNQQSRAAVPKEITKQSCRFQSGGTPPCGDQANFVPRPGT